MNLAAWFEDVSNYDGVADETGTGAVTVAVGVKVNGDAFGFGSAAVRVNPGTTITWSWTGRGGSHNVAATEGAFDSDLTGSGDHTFEHAFENAGVYTYACTPHETLDMKGAVVVGDVDVATGGGAGPPSGADADRTGPNAGSGETENARVAAPFGDAGARRLGGLALGGAVALALASPGCSGRSSGSPTGTTPSDRPTRSNRSRGRDSCVLSARCEHVRQIPGPSEPDRIYTTRFRVSRPV